MHDISPELLEEFKAIFKKEYGKEFKSDDEAREAARNLTGFFEIIYDLAKREHFRRLRLKKEPKGFYLEEDGSVYNCMLCHEAISGKTGWWDLNGQKCLNCQRAVDKGVVPKNVFKKRDSWHADWELQSKFHIHSSTIRKLIRKGQLKSRDVMTDEDRVHFRVFLMKENPSLVNKPTTT